MLFVFTEAPPCDKRNEQCREDSEGCRPSSLGMYHPPSSPECTTSPPSARRDVAPKLVIAPSPDTMMEPSDAEGNRPYTPVESPKSVGHTPTSSSVTSEAVSPVEPWAPSSPDRHGPIDVLQRVFPYTRRSLLQLVLHGCHGDVVHAIEQVLNNHCGDSQLLYNPMHPMAPSPYSLTGRPNYTGTGDTKSAFSPLSTVTPNPFSYGYAGASGRGVAFALPYPPALLPNLATFSYSFNAMAAAAAASMEAHNSDAGVEDALAHLYRHTSPTAEKID